MVNPGSASIPRILVIDDNLENRALAQATLEDEGYKVTLASSGEEGIVRFVETSPDCVLLDVRMPGTDGFAVCTRIRAMPKGAHTPVVFLTALRDVDTFDQALRSGGDDFLTRPVRPTELLVRVQAAVKLRRMSAELREHYELVRRQRDDLMRLQLQKERLSAFLVHDLKNPVNSMDLHAQLMLSDQTLSPTSRASANHIRDEARNLSRLLLNLLDLSKSEEGRLTVNRGWIDLVALASDLIDSYRLKASSAEVTLTKTLEVAAVEADPDLLKRVLENLIDNAIRHAPPGSAVNLGAFGWAGGIQLQVADAGAGVPAEKRGEIFERFVQLEGEKARSGSGRGLGLAFCKLAVEAQGGSLWVEDAGPGARFCVGFPVRR